MKKLGCKDGGKQQKDAQRHLSTAVWKQLLFSWPVTGGWTGRGLPRLLQKRLSGLHRMVPSSLKQCPPGGISCCTQTSGQTGTWLPTGAVKQKGPCLNCHRHSEELVWERKGLRMLKAWQGGVCVHVPVGTGAEPA